MRFALPTHSAAKSPSCDQALATTPRPLVVMTPKSLLRLKESVSTLDDLAAGEFHAVLDDPLTSTDAKARKKVRSLLLCTGKIYYELALDANRAAAEDVAIARVEMLNPLPIEDILALVREYPNLEQMNWVQEEPANMGAWPFLARIVGLRRPYDIRWGYIGRSRRASPSEGYAGSHKLEQERIVRTALSTSHTLSGDAPEKREPVLVAPDPKTAGDS